MTFKTLNPKPSTTWHHKWKIDLRIYTINHKLFLHLWHQTQDYQAKTSNLICQPYSWKTEKNGKPRLSNKHPIYFQACIFFVSMMTLVWSTPSHTHIWHEKRLRSREISPWLTFSGVVTWNNPVKVLDSSEKLFHWALYCWVLIQIALELIDIFK